MEVRELQQSIRRLRQQKSQQDSDTQMTAQEDYEADMLANRSVPMGDSEDVVSLGDASGTKEALHNPIASSSTSYHSSTDSQHINGDGSAAIFVLCRHRGLIPWGCLQDHTAAT